MFLQVDELNFNLAMQEHKQGLDTLDFFVFLVFNQLASNVVTLLKVIIALAELLLLEVEFAEFFVDVGSG